MAIILSAAEAERRAHEQRAADTAARAAAAAASRTGARRTSIGAASTATSSAPRSSLTTTLPRIPESRVATSAPPIPLRRSASTLTASDLQKTPFRPPTGVSRRPLRRVPAEAAGGGATERSLAASNVILKIGDERLNVSKELLSQNSPEFEAMFFGKFAAKGKVEVELKDVDCEEFKDLLQAVESGSENISDRTVLHILKLADRFQMKEVLRLSEAHLTQSKGFGAMKKLQLADQYRLVTLQDHCIKSFTSAVDILLKLKISSEFDNFSDVMTAAICRRMVEIARE